MATEQELIVFLTFVDMCKNNQNTIETDQDNSKKRKRCKDTANIQINNNDVSIISNTIDTQPVVLDTMTVNKLLEQCKKAFTLIATIINSQGIYSKITQNKYLPNNKHNKIIINYWKNLREIIKSKNPDFNTFSKHFFYLRKLLNHLDSDSEKMFINLYQTKIDSEKKKELKESMYFLMLMTIIVKNDLVMLITFIPTLHNITSNIQKLPDNIIVQNWKTSSNTVDINKTGTCIIYNLNQSFEVLTIILKNETDTSLQSSVHIQNMKEYYSILNGIIFLIKQLVDPTRINVESKQKYIYSLLEAFSFLKQMIKHINIMYSSILNNIYTSSQNNSQENDILKNNMYLLLVMIQTLPKDIFCLKQFFLKLSITNI